MTRRVTENVPRRRFLKTTAAGAAGLTFIKARSVAGTEANSKVELGIIGSGGRGVWIGNLFQKHSPTRVVALADAFADRLHRGRAKLKVDADRCYKGLDAYRELLDSKVDAVAVQSPPYFHPEHTAAAVDAGKHVYLAKPVAVDVPGCQAVVDAARRGAGKVSVFVDFQTRSTGYFQEAARRVHKGDIGEPVCGQVFYHAGRLFPQRTPPGASSDARRLRNWVFDQTLSGDIIVEQNIHVVDVANWYLQAVPIEATGAGGRKGRTDIGDCRDHFVVTYRYPDDVLIDFGSTQFLQGYSDLGIRLFGTRGTIESHYAGRVAITGRSPWTGAANKVESIRGKKYERLASTGNENMYTAGAIANIKTFIEAVARGRCLDNARESADSTLACILGRTAAYAGRTVTWTELIEANAKLETTLTL